MKTKTPSATQMYLLASVTMVALSGFVIICLLQIKCRLNIFENGIVLMPFINLFMAVFAIPKRWDMKNLFKKLL